MIHAYAAKEAKGTLQPFEYDPGKLAADEVEIDVAYCGICHSDVSMIDNDWGLSQYPLVPGHEVAGTVSKVGDQVSHLQVGDKVGLGWHAGYCDDCSPCGAGEENLCGDATGTIIGRHGGFADKVRAQGKAVVKLPDALDMEYVGPLLCGGITVFNPLVQFSIEPTAKVGVIGIGGLGHMALQFLNAWGCEVTAFTHSDSKRDEAKELGAHHTLDSTDTHALEEAAGRFDMILSTVNVALDWNAYLNTIKPKGRLHFVGAALEPLDINVFNLIAQQRSVSGSPVGSPSTIKTMLEFAVRHNIAPKVEVFDMDKVNDALDHLRDGKARYRVVLKRSA